MANGYVKIWRQIEESFFYRDSHYVHLWVHLLFKANHEKREFLIGNQKVVCERGQCVTGRKAIEEETGINQFKVMRMLKVMETTQQITQQKTSKFTLITIVNYDKYQGDGEHQVAQQMHNKCTTVAHKQEVDVGVVVGVDVKEVEVGKEVKSLTTTTGAPKASRVFVPPTPQEVEEYAKSIGFDLDGAYFVAYHEASGWMRGKTKISRWKAVVQTWKHNNSKGGYSGTGKRYFGARHGDNTAGQVDTSKYDKAGFTE